MKIKALIAIFLALLMLSSVAIATFIPTFTEERKLVVESNYVITFSPPQIEEKEGYSLVSMDGTNQMMMSPGLPQLPKYSTILPFPFGTRILDITMENSEVYSLDVEKEILPAANAIPVKTGEWPMQRVKGHQYQEDSLYPGVWYEYRPGVGISGDTRELFLLLEVYPVQYHPLIHQLTYIKEAEITVRFEQDNDIKTAPVEYDLLILCPDEWETPLEEFVTHKENHGIQTMLVTLGEISNGEYFSPQGRDDAEQVKYFIKNAVEEWGITHVLLVGGRKPGLREEWLMPVRYAYVYWADEGSYTSDLYFADIYDSTYNFSSWDTDNNDVFSEWPRNNILRDKMDLYPDVYIGRWACRNQMELDIMISKTIAYETGSTAKRVILAGGDNFPQAGIEGEIVCDKTLQYLPGYEADKIYVTQMDVTSKAIKDGMNKGSTFLHLHGHGSPIYWSTHKEEGFDKWEDGLKFYDLPFFFNTEYPIALVGGCHTAMFNVSFTIHPWTGGIPAYEGISWWLARKYNGGAIAALGYTCFPVASPGEYGDLDGDGIEEPDCVESGYGYMQLRLIYAHGMEEKEYLGDCWGDAVSKYIDVFSHPNAQHHLHTLQGFVLLGDPSLKIGGYGSR